MSLRLMRTRTALLSAMRASKRSRAQQMTAAAAAESDRYDAATRRAGAAAGGGPLAAAVAALACFTAWDDITVCDGEKIVWVDAHGKKVAVHEKTPPRPSQAAGQPDISKPARYYPYVILGYGVAGKAALAALLERDPFAKVLVVDVRTDAEDEPNLSAEISAGSPQSGVSGGLAAAWRVATKSAAAAGSGVEFARGVRATALDADLGHVTLLTMPPPRSSSGTASDDSTAHADVYEKRAWAGGAGGDGQGLVAAPPLEGSGEEGIAPAGVTPPKREVVAFGRCLLALGSRPRPPPPGFVDPDAIGSVALLGARHAGIDREELRREVVAGRSVTVVGSSWQALELACWLQAEGQSAAAAGDEGAGGTCRMVFSDYAPLDHVLPRYLSVALLRRLNRKNIKTIGHSSLRWVGLASQRFAAPLRPPLPPPPEEVGSNVVAAAAVAEEEREIEEGRKPEGEGATALVKSDAVAVLLPPPSSSGVIDPSGAAPGAAAAPAAAATTTMGDGGDSAQAGGQHKRRPRRRLQVMTAHSFDHLDTATHSTDRVVLAGVDVAPLDFTLDLSGGDRGGPGDRYRKRAAPLEVDRRRGAVVVNGELSASSRVWVAGDAACFPSQAHGGRRRVIRSADHAYHSGRVAGENMAAAAAAAGAVGGGAKGGTIDEGGRRYRHTPAFVGEAPLAGVRVAMIGECDAAMTTHGFWWTNSATGLSRKSTHLACRSSSGGGGLAKRRTIAVGGNPSGSEGGAVEDSAGVTLESRSTVRKEFTPVFGTGVVFYTVGSEIKGAMLWGFPGEATAAAAAAASGAPGGLLAADASSEGRGGSGGGSSGGVDQHSAADEAAAISARALDMLRIIMERSANMEADLSDERIMQAWVQGLSDAARVVVQETGVAHLQPMRRSIAGRVTSSTKRPPGTRDELMYQNTGKTSSAQRRLNAAYAARIRGVSPADMPDFGGGAAEAEFDPLMMGFLSYGDVDGYSGVFGGGLTATDGENTDSEGPDSSS